MTPRSPRPRRKQLKRSAAPSGQIRRKQRAHKLPQPVTTRWVEPTPKLERAEAEPTEKQLGYLAVLARRCGTVPPEVATRAEASTAIGRFRAVLARRTGKDPGAGKQADYRLRAEHNATRKPARRLNPLAWRGNREWMSDAEWQMVCAAMGKQVRPP